MLANRKELVAGAETAFSFVRYDTRSVLVKNETSGAILFCDGLFNADTAASIPAFSWQVFNVAIKIGESPFFTVRADVSGPVEINFGSSGMGALLGPGLDVVGMIPHTLAFTAGANTTLTVSLIRLHGETLDLDSPVSISSGATVFSGDVVTFDATATEEGHHPVLTVNGEEVELSEGSATVTIAGDTAATVEAIAD